MLIIIFFINLITKDSFKNRENEGLPFFQD